MTRAAGGAEAAEAAGVAGIVSAAASLRERCRRDRRASLRFRFGPLDTVSVAEFAVATSKTGRGRPLASATPSANLVACQMMICFFSLVLELRSRSARISNAYRSARQLQAGFQQKLGAYLLKAALVLSGQDDVLWNGSWFYGRGGRGCRHTC